MNLTFGSDIWEDLQWYSIRKYFWKHKQITSTFVPKILPHILVWEIDNWVGSGWEACT